MYKRQASIGLQNGADRFHIVLPIPLLPEIPGAGDGRELKKARVIPQLIGRPGAVISLRPPQRGCLLYTSLCLLRRFGRFCQVLFLEFRGLGGGFDVNFIAGEPGCQAGVLALFADGQAQLIVGDHHPAGDVYKRQALAIAAVLYIPMKRYFAGQDIRR